MKKVIWLFAVCILLCACKAEPAAPNLASTDFEAELAFSIDERDYTVRYTKSAAGDALAFDAPKSLCGMQAVRQTSGALTVTIGDLTYTSAAADGMFGFTKLFAPPDGALHFVSETDGMRCFSGSDGDDRYTMYTDTDGLPLRLSGVIGGREYDIRILRFVRMERSDPT